MKAKFIPTALIIIVLLAILPAGLAEARWDGGTGTGPGGVGATDGSSSLELWLSGGTGAYTDTTCSTAAGTGNGVACWADQSGNGINFTQGTAGNRPTYGTVSLNGVSALRFDGTTDFLNGGNVLDLTQLSVFTVVIPRNVQATGGDQKIVTRGYDGTNTQWEFGTSGTGTAATNDLTFLAYPSAGATSTSTLSNGTAITGGGSYGASGWRMWFNGQLQSTTANAAPASNTRSAIVGAVSTGGTYAAPMVTQRWNGDIGEVIVFSGQVNSAQRNLISNYLGTKYNIAMLANDLYTGNGAGYYIDVAGIGQESDGDNTVAHSAGLVIQESGGSLANGEYILGGYASTSNSTTTADLPASVASRWTRDWYIDKTGTVDSTLSFDFSEGGMGGTPSGGYVLLYRSGTSGTYSVVSLSSGPAIAGDQVQFAVPDADLLDGYYTLGIDDTAPSVDITDVTPDPRNTSVTSVEIVFTENVVGFDIDDLSLTLDGAPVSLAAATLSGGPATYTLDDLDGLTGTDGTYVLTLTAAGSGIGDLGGNALTTDAEDTWVMDATSPTATIDQAAGQADPTSTSPINFLVTFDEPVDPATFTEADITLGGAAGATSVTITQNDPPNDGTSFNVEVSGMTSDGTVTIDLASGLVEDLSGNTNGDSTISDNEVTYDTNGPTATIDQAAGQADPTNFPVINFLVTFDEPIDIATFTSDDITTGGTAPGALSVVITQNDPPNDGTLFNVEVSGMTGSGTVTIDLGAEIVNDLAGNSNWTSNIVDNEVTYDMGWPTATIDQAVGQNDPTNFAPINFLVTFDEPIDTATFTDDDITTGGTAPGILSVTITQNDPPNDDTSFNVAVNGMTGNGTVTIDLGAERVLDPSGNPSLETVIKDNEVTYDTSGLRATIDQAAGQTDPTGVSPINFLVTFNKAINISSFTNDDIAIGGTAPGTLTASISQNDPPNDGTSFNIAVSGMTDSGTVTIDLFPESVVDLAGNQLISTFLTDNEVTYDIGGPTATIDQAVGQTDPTNVSPINFLITFDEPIDPATFINTDINLNGTAGATTVQITQNNPPADNTSFNVAVSGMTDSGTVIINLPAGKVQDESGNGNRASKITDNTVTFDTNYPVVVNGGIVGQPDEITIINNGSYTTHFTRIDITFNKEVADPLGSTAPDDVTNPANYLLIQTGPDHIYDTLSCAGGLKDDDIRIPTGPVVYINATRTAQVTVNNQTPLPSGEYRLFICGTTSIVDLAGNPLNGGNDDAITFEVFDAYQPSTGFAPGRRTVLPAQPVEKAFSALGGTWIEIPALKVESAIVGVPATSNGWDITWLNKSIGWLDGTAFPSWNGNSVLTAHVYDYNGLPGPFAKLKDLKYGDYVFVHAFGQKYTFAVRNSLRVRPTDTAYTFQHLPGAPYLTLVTCEDYQEASDTYTYRRVVRLVLVAVQEDK